MLMGGCSTSDSSVELLHCLLLGTKIEYRARLPALLQQFKRSRKYH